MKLRMVGCSHNQASIEIRQRLAFDSKQVGRGLSSMAQGSPRD